MKLESSTPQYTSYFTTRWLLRCGWLCAFAITLLVLHTSAFGITFGVTFAVYAQAGDESQTELRAVRAEAERLLQHAIMLLETETNEDAWTEAATELQTALQLFRQIARRDLEASAWQQIGQAYSRLGKYDRSLHAFESAAEIAAEIDDIRRLVKAQTGLGRTHHAIATFQNQLADGETNRVPNQAAYRSARRAFEQALANALTLEDDALVLPILIELAQLNAETERLDEAFANYESAAGLAAEDSSLLAEIYAAQGRILRQQGEHSEAVQLLVQALDLAAQSDDEPSISTARLYLDLARSHRDLEEWESAIQQLTTAQELLESSDLVDDDKLVQTILALLASLYEEVGDEEQLAVVSAKLLTIAPHAARTQTTLQRQYASAKALAEEGKYLDAIDGYLTVLSLVRKNRPDAPDERDVLARLAALESQLGRCDRILQQYERAFDSAKISADQAYFLRELGALHQRLGQFDESNRALRDALALLADNVDLSLKSSVATELGTTLQRSGHSQESVEFLEQGIRLARMAGAIEAEIDARVELGRAYRNLDQPQDALRLLNRALAQTKRLALANNASEPLEESSTDRQSAHQLALLEALSLHEIGRIYLAEADHSAAVEQLTDALAAVELSISNVRVADLETGIGAVRLQVAILLDLTKASRLRGELNNAEAYLKEAETLVAEFDSGNDVHRGGGCGGGFKQQVYHSQIALEKARIFLASDEIEEALAAYQQAIDSTVEPVDKASILIEFGDVQRDLTNSTVARTVYTTARSVTLVDISNTVPLSSTVLVSPTVPISPTLLISSTAPLSIDLNRAAQMYVKASTRLGLLHADAGEIDLALDHLNEALTTAQVIQNLVLQSDVLTDIGRVNVANVQYDEAYKAFVAALDTLRQTKDAVPQSRMGEFDFSQAKILIELGKVAQRQQNLDAALDWYQQAKSILNKLEATQVNGKQDVSSEFVQTLSELHGNILERMGGIYNRRGATALALRAYREAADVAAKTNNFALEARTLGRAGQIYREIGQFDRALQIARQIGDLELEDKTLASMGQFYRESEQHEQAVDLFRAALLVAQTRGDERQQSTIQIELGRIYRSLAEYEEAVAQYESALTLTESVGNRNQAVEIRLELGRIYIQLGEPTDAIALFKSALGDDEHVLDDELTLKLQSSLAQSYRAIGDWKAALQTSQSALDLAQKSQNTFYEEESLSALGEAYSNLGRRSEALTMYEQALTTAQKQRDSKQEIRLLLAIGDLYFDLAGDDAYAKVGSGYEEALQHFEDALARSVAEAAYNSQHVALLKIGQTYNRLGRLADVQATQNQMLWLAQAADNVVWEIEALELLGRSYRDARQYARAVEPFQQALILAQELADRKQEQTLLENLASLYRDLGQQEKALVAYDQILDSATLYGDLELELSALENIGKLQRQMGKTLEAADSFDRLLTMARSTEDLSTERVALLHLARTRADQWRLDDALALMEQVLDTVQIADNDTASQWASSGTIWRSRTALNPSDLGDEELALAASTLREMGTLYRYSGQYAQAFSHYADALSHWQMLGDRAKTASVMPVTNATPVTSTTSQSYQSEEARTLIHVGTAHTELGEYRAALKNFAQALQLVEPEVDVTISSFALTIKSGAENSADSTREDVTDTRVTDTIAILKKIAGTYYAMGNYSAAVVTSERGLGFARESELYSLQVDLLQELGKAQRKRGNHGAALELNQEALSIHQQHSELTSGLSDTSAERAIILNRIGKSLDDLERYERAIETFSEAREIAHEFEEIRLEAEIYRNIGDAYRDSKQLEIALENYSEARSLYQQLGDQQSEAQALNRVGEAYLRLRQPQQALGAFQRALRIAEDVDDSKLSSNVLINLAETHEQLEDLTEAARSYARAIDAFSVGPVELEAYQNIVSLLIEGNRTGDAFRYVQHSQAQHFLHEQGNPWIDYAASAHAQPPTGTGHSKSVQGAVAESKQTRAASLIEQEQTLRRQIVGVRQAEQRIRKQLTDPFTASQNAVLSNRLKNKAVRLANEYESTINELQVIQPNYASYFDVDTLGDRRAHV